MGLYGTIGRLLTMCLAYTMCERSITLPMTAGNPQFHHDKTNW